ncbi:MAG: UDP-glucose 4-epimerase GalE [Chlamydiia bacterium]|nr:UDP-glucose 4-epimerase GalE [Chlamydiia bacterium]
MTHVLVTGGAGYIGSHVCKRLSRAGYVPVVYDNLSTGNKEAVKWGPFVEGELTDQEKIKATLKQYAVEGVFHFAASTNVRASVKETMPYFQNNVGASLDLIEAVCQSNISYFVFSSSCAVYGMPQKLPLDESHPRAPINGYGESKAMIEDVLFRVSQNLGLHVASLRYFNAAGCDEEGEIGESPKVHTHLIPLLLEAVLKEEGSFTLFGNNHKTEDGTPIRDYIHVEDLAEAHLMAYEWMKKNKKNLLLNLGTGNGHSIKEVIKLVEEVTGKKVPLTVAEKNPGDPPILFANPEKAKTILGWRASHLDLKKTIASTWKWMNR